MAGRSFKEYFTLSKVVIKVGMFSGAGYYIISIVETFIRSGGTHGIHTTWPHRP
jgi:hypothetical protein